MIETISEHSVEVPVAGPVLDAGCRSFAFSRAMALRGLGVVALDPDPTVENPGIPGVRYRREALLGAARGPVAFFMDRDPQARRVASEGHVTVTSTDMHALMRATGVQHWGVVKLDVEGCEYGILASWPGPIADQITIEFHEHISPAPQSTYDSILAHLGQWYDVVQHEKSYRHCIGTPNYWDSLFRLRK